MKPWLLRTLLWAGVLAGGWYAWGVSYVVLVGRTASSAFPDGVFLLLRPGLLSLGLGDPRTFTGAHLDLQAHNLGFGIVVLGAAVLGTPGRPWLVRCGFLAAGWGLLFVTHVGVLLAAATAYRTALEGSGGGARLLSEAVHPALVVLPTALAIAWTLATAREPDRPGKRAGEHRSTRRDGLSTERSRGRRKARHALR